MKLFLIKTASFLFFFWGGILLLIGTSNYFIVKNADFKLGTTIHTILLGNSQPECAFNDSLISNFKNLANGGETYFYNYQKLKELIKQNPQITTVFIEFNETNIRKREDVKIWSDRYVNHLLPIYFSYLELNDHRLLALKNSTGYPHAALKSLFGNIKRIVKNQYNYIDSIGGYNYLKRNKTKGILDSLDTTLYKPIPFAKNQLSMYDIEYLEKIISLCQQNNIKPYFVRSPVHEKFDGFLYEELFQQVKQERFSYIPFLDFKDFPLEDFHYADLQHLNYKGAKLFSKMFNSWLLQKNPLNGNIYK